MARKQVIVQLDDQLVRDLDEVAAQESISRSEVIRRAARVFVTARLEARWDREHEESYRRMPQDPAENAVYMRLAAEAVVAYEAGESGETR